MDFSRLGYGGKKGLTSTIPMLSDVVSFLNTQGYLRVKLLFVTKDYSRFRCGTTFIHVQITVSPGEEWFR